MASARYTVHFEKDDVPITSESRRGDAEWACVVYAKHYKRLVQVKDNRTHTAIYAVDGSFPIEYTNGGFRS